MLMLLGMAAVIVAIITTIFVALQFDMPLDEFNGLTGAVLSVVLFACGFGLAIGLGVASQDAYEARGYVFDSINHRVGISLEPPVVPVATPTQAVEWITP